jgi:hypothetical protein
VTLGPAEVHPQEDLGPIGSLGAAGSGADGQERIALVVLTAKEQIAACDAVLGFEFGSLAGDVGQETLVLLFLSESEQLQRRLGTRFQVSPELEFSAKSLGFAKRLLRTPLVVPETRLTDGSVQLG